jgi:hypothetical protein
LKAVARDGLLDISCPWCGEWVASGAFAPRGEREALCLSCLERAPGAAFGQRLKAHRLAAGLTALALARRAKVAAHLVRCYEKNLYHPGPAIRARLARALGVGPAGLGPDYLAPGWRGRGRPKKGR